MVDRLEAVSPLDGRYRGRTEPLVPYVSEAALMRGRVTVEIKYLLALADRPEIELSLTEKQQESLQDVYESFDSEDAALIKQIETEGYKQYPATNHDVKAVEYFIQLQTDEEIHPWIHFGLTSEDVNNLAYRLLVTAAIEEVLLPELYAIGDQLQALATRYRSLPMLARTHGQPATPTTFGKEMAVFARRLARATAEIERATENMGGKLGGASGTLAAHQVAYPEVDWTGFAKTFVNDLGLDYLPLTTQVNPSDDLATVFDAIKRANTIVLDLDQDMWRYISDRYLGQDAADAETGSSTMPHKVNPIDFENSEGNLSKANADLEFLGAYLTTSRLQRDLSDSTVKRTIGGTLAHSLIGYTKTQTGLDKVVPNEQVITDTLQAHPEVIGEAVQTILRREGKSDAYERVKELTRGQEVTIEDFHELFADLDLSADVLTELQDLTPEGYTGLAADLTGHIED